MQPGNKPPQLEPLKTLPPTLTTRKHSKTGKFIKVYVTIGLALGAWTAVREGMIGQLWNMGDTTKMEEALKKAIVTGHAQNGVGIPVKTSSGQHTLKIIGSSVGPSTESYNEREVCVTAVVDKPTGKAVNACASTRYIPINRKHTP